ncbi:MAG: phosphomannomutase/phosphoglucomutase [Planctomycetota bacterium]
MPEPFKAYDIRGLYPSVLNEDLAYRIGNATAQHLDLAGKRYAVARDMRLSGPALKAAFVAGLVDAGVHVVDCGMISTPALTFAMHHLDTAGGAQITASHNPPGYGGIKITGPGFIPVAGDSGMPEIEKLARNCTVVKRSGGEVSEALILDAYTDFLAGGLDLERDITVVVDGGNGIIGTMFQSLAHKLPGLKLIPMLFDPDGRFPVHEANPLKNENLAWLQDKVKQTGADFGAGFDGDGDRCALVDEQGRIISCDLATAMVAEYFLEREPGCTVCYDLRSSKIVPEVVEQRGGRAVETPVGHTKIKARMKKEQAIFAGELSGHYYFRDFFGGDSGLYAFILFCNVLSRSTSTSERIAPLRKYHHSGEINFKADKDAAFARIRELDGATITELDGLTVRYDHWWANVRASNTEPVVRLNMEADNADLLESKLSEMKRLITS